jgi:acyl-coenzyme A synthetase/AMP-(fatty) acid ligase
MGSDLFGLVESGFRQHPQAPALVTPHGQIVSYERLELTILRFMCKLQDAGVQRTAHVAIDIRNPAVVVALILAISRLGAVYVAGSTISRIQIEGLHLDFVISDTIRPRGNVREILFTQEWSVQDSPQPVLGSGLEDEHATAAIISSSGTTGTPKFMAFPISLIEQRLDDHDTVHGQGPSKCLITFGLGSPFGLELVLRMLRLGGMVAWPVQSALHTLEQISSLGITEIYTAPGTLSELAYEQRRCSLDLTNLSRIVTAGSGLSAAVADLARQHLTQQILNEYGSSELGPVSCIQAGSGEPGTVGEPAPWINVRVDPQDGKLSFRGQDDRLPAGYLNSSIDSPIVTDDGWFTPGDYGHLDTSGRLVITGRQTSLINTGGNKISATELEATVCRLEGVKACVAVPLPNEFGYDDIGLAIVADDGFAEEAALRQLSNTYENTARVVLIRVEQVPRLPGGKVDLQHVGQLLEGARRSEVE